MILNLCSLPNLHSIHFVKRYFCCIEQDEETKPSKWFSWLKFSFEFEETSIKIFSYYYTVRESHKTYLNINSFINCKVNLEISHLSLTEGVPSILS